MVLFNYTKLFSLKVLHNYYGSKISGDLFFEPTSACASRLNKPGPENKETARWLYSFLGG